MRLTTEARDEGRSGIVGAEDAVFEIDVEGAVVVEDMGADGAVMVAC